MNMVVLWLTWSILIYIAVSSVRLDASAWRFIRLSQAPFCFAELLWHWILCVCKNKIKQTSRNFTFTIHKKFKKYMGFGKIYMLKFCQNQRFMMPTYTRDCLTYKHIYTKHYVRTVPQNQMNSSFKNIIAALCMYIIVLDGPTKAASPVQSSVQFFPQVFF